MRMGRYVRPELRVPEAAYCSEVKTACSDEPRDLPIISIPDGFWLIKCEDAEDLVELRC